MLTIRAYHRDRGDHQRDICLIPVSAHGTNPASAQMVGMEVVVVQSAPNGDVDVADFRAKAEAAGDRLVASMITYPSTHGVFEETVREICDITHQYGGQVYIDGANMNAMVGLVRPVMSAVMSVTLTFIRLSVFLTVAEVLVWTDWCEGALGTLSSGTRR